MAISWANIKTFFYGVIGDTEGTNTFFSTAQVLDVAKSCLREIGDRTHCYDMVTSGSLQIGTPVVGTSGYGVWRVEVDDHVVRPITSDKLRHTDPFWETRSGEPWFYLIDEFSTTPSALNIRLYEIPDDDYTYRIYTYGEPSEPSDSVPTNLIHLPEWFAYALVWGMLAKIYGADTPMRNEEIASFYGMLFEDAVMRLRARSFSRLANEWEMDPSDQEYKYSIWNRIPSTITGP